MKRISDKRGVELAFNAIIIAILVLIVLAVVIMIFLGGMKTVAEQISEFLAPCEERGGTCSNTPCPEGQSSSLLSGGCAKIDSKGKPRCCLPDG